MLSLNMEKIEADLEISLDKAAMLQENSEALSKVLDDNYRGHHALQEAGDRLEESKKRMSRARKRYDSGKMPEEDYLDEQDRFYFVKRDFRRKNNQQKKNHESIRELRNQREQIKSELMARVENGGY